MAKLTQDMKDIAAKSRPFILATSSKDGIPNAVPIGIFRINSDDEIVLADNFMLKTRKNLEENPAAAVTYWSPDDRYGYQLKGKTRIETSGKHYDETARGMEERKVPFKPKAVVILTVEEAYYVGSGKDSGKNLI
jgi:predicted pyridoxine 5'-phosphate oxidase superfamily flavin-nucleotide-binding protein